MEPFGPRYIRVTVGQEGTVFEGRLSRHRHRSKVHSLLQAALGRAIHCADTGRWSIVPIVVAALAFFVAAFFVFADLTPDDAATNTEGTSIQPMTTPHPR